MHPGEEFPIEWLGCDGMKGDGLELAQNFRPRRVLIVNEGQQTRDGAHLASLHLLDEPGDIETFTLCVCFGW